jgi:hypothetical protein
MLFSFLAAIMNMRKLPDISGIGSGHVVSLPVVFLRYPDIIEIEGEFL